MQSLGLLLPVIAKTELKQSAGVRSWCWRSSAVGWERRPLVIKKVSLVRKMATPRTHWHQGVEAEAVSFLGFHRLPEKPVLKWNVRGLMRGMHLWFWRLQSGRVCLVWHRTYTSLKNNHRRQCVTQTHQRLFPMEQSALWAGLKALKVCFPWGQRLSDSPYKRQAVHLRWSSWSALHTRRAAPALWQSQL